jgi:hypothetical protein
MYTPDSYYYETNLMLLATLSDEELADPELLAQLAPGAAFGPVVAWLADICKGALASLLAAFTYVPDGDESAAYWLYRPMF